MNYKALLAVSIALLVLVGPAKSITSEEFEKQVDLYYSSEEKFCWKNSYGRGVGTIPSSCSGNKYKDDGLCYEHCRDDYKAVGPVCWKNCGKGRKDAGLFCLEKWLGMWVKPAKKDSYGRGVGTIPSNCGDKENDAGLCYPQCKENYNGVGPVCWRKCGGDTPTDCGAACANKASTCVSKILNMVQSVVEMIANIVEMVGTGGASAVAKTSAKQVMWQALIAIAKKFKAQKYTKQAFIHLMKKKGMKIGASVSEKVLSTVFDESDNPVDQALNVLSQFDPTGAIDVVIAFKQDVC